MEKNDKIYLLTYDVRRTMKILLEIDTLPGTRKSQKIFFQWAQQKLQEEGGLKSVLEEKSVLLTKLRETELGLLPDLDFIAKRAIRKGAIQLGLLVYIMAEENEYEKTLPILCDFFGRSVTRGIKKGVVTETIEDRIGVWLNMLTLWGGVDLDPHRNDAEEPGSNFLEHPILGRIASGETYLNLYNESGELKLFAKVWRSDSDFVKLEDLQNYLEDIGETLNINFPLPKRLFPDGREEEKEVTEETDKPVSDDYEAFIRKLQVSFQSNSEIKIQVPKRPARLYNCASLGFRDEETKTWKLLINVLQDPDHSINIGPAHKSSHALKQSVKNYSNQLKQLDEINIKLGKFINKVYNHQMPKDFKFYERRKNEKPGTYGFKFQVTKNIVDGKIWSKYDQWPKNKLILEIKRLHKEFKEDTKEDPKIKGDLTNAIQTVRTKGWMTDDEINDMIRENKGKEEIIYDPYENREDSDQD